MAPTIDIIRHAQAHHNVLGPYVRDPGITDEGEEECYYLRSNYPFGNEVTLVFSSPLRRAIDTAVIGIMPIVHPSIKIMLLPELQEVNATPSSTGSPKERLRKLYDPKTVDVSPLKKKWYRKDPDSPFEPTPSKVEERARTARGLLQAMAQDAVDTGRPDAHIVVVTHGEFAHWLTEDFVGVSGTRNSDWANVEMRSYQFASLDAPEASLVETPESIAARCPRVAWAQLTEPERAVLKEMATTRAQKHSEHARTLRAMCRKKDEEEEDEWVDVDDEEA